LFPNAVSGLPKSILEGVTSREYSLWDIAAVEKCVGDSGDFGILDLDTRGVDLSV